VSQLQRLIHDSSGLLPLVICSDKLPDEPVVRDTVYLPLRQINYLPEVCCMLQQTARSSEGKRYGKLVSKIDELLARFLSPMV
jgi:hypothetical protein